MRHGFPLRAAFRRDYDASSIEIRSRESKTTVLATDQLDGSLKASPPGDRVVLRDAGGAVRGKRRREAGHEE